jgi:hypothetical protein
LSPQQSPLLEELDSGTTASPSQLSVMSAKPLWPFHPHLLRLLENNVSNQLQQEIKVLGEE